MATSRAPARSAANWHAESDCWLDHAKIVEQDYEWLVSVQKLTLWNVDVPRGFLARLDRLWWLDLRGGSATSLDVARGAAELQYLAVNQVRGMQDLGVVSNMTSLRYLDLYGLPHVTCLPSLAALSQLEHACLGQMRGLLSLQGLLEAPRLNDLQLLRKINVTAGDVEGIKRHPTIQRFGWFAEDVPYKVWAPVVEAIGLPPVPYGFPADWFASRRS
jgi:hypothetical protein